MAADHSSAARASVTTRLRGWLARPEMRDHPVRTVSRRLRYEAYKRNPSDRGTVERRIRFDDDLIVYVRPSEVIDHGLFLYGIYERAASSVFVRLMRPGMTVVDAGAHAGQYTLLAAKRLGPGGRVIAFEPNPEALRRLRRNIRANRFEDRVTIHERALGDTNTTMVLHASDDDLNLGGASLLPQPNAPSTIEVMCSRLDDVIGEERIDVMKVDVEGFESQVLEGARGALGLHRPIVQFEVNGLTVGSSGWTAPAIEALRSLGYGIYVPVPASGDRWRLAPFDPRVDPVLTKERGSPVNLFAVHPARSEPATPLL